MEYFASFASFAVAFFFFLHLLKVQPLRSP